MLSIPTKGLMNNLLKEVRKSNNLQNSVNWYSLLLHFYCSKLTGKKSRQILLEAFKKIKTAPDLLQNSDFWTNNSALVFSLEILEKNEFIETDLAYVLQDFNIWLTNSLARQKNSMSLEDYPFYAQLLLNRLNHVKSVDENNKVLFIQIAETLVQKLDVPIIDFKNDIVHWNVIALILINKQGVYGDIIQNIFQRFVNGIEKQYNLDIINPIYLNNLIVYFHVCKVIRTTPKIDIRQSFTKWITGHHSFNENIPVLDKFYLLNSLIQYNFKIAANIFSQDIENILQIENQILSQNLSKENSLEEVLLILTIHSFLHPDHASWDEILLVPSF